MPFTARFLGGNVMLVQDCLFCGIIQKKIPSIPVYEDKNFFAFLDIGPVNKGHVLVIPKEHSDTLFGVRSELGSSLLAIIQKLGKAVMQATGASGLNVMQNNYRSAGQEVDHVHWHIIPRFYGDGHDPWAKNHYRDNEEMNTIADAIKKHL